MIQTLRKNTAYLPMVAKWLCIDGVVLWSFSVVVGGSVITRVILGGVPSTRRHRVSPPLNQINVIFSDKVLSIMILYITSLINELASWKWWQFWYIIMNNWIMRVNR
jgi:hypothetical protein